MMAAPTSRKSLPPMAPHVPPVSVPPARFVIPWTVRAPPPVASIVPWLVISPALPLEPTSPEFPCTVTPEPMVSRTADRGNEQPIAGGDTGKTHGSGAAQRLAALKNQGIRGGDVYGTLVERQAAGHVDRRSGKRRIRQVEGAGQGHSGQGPAVIGRNKLGAARRRYDAAVNRAIFNVPGPRGGVQARVLPLLLNVLLR